MSQDDLIAELVQSEEAGDYEEDDAIYDGFVDEDQIRGRAKRGNNKTALKNAKGLAGATNTMPATPRKSPTKDAQKAATPRSIIKTGADKSDWETKFQVSTGQNIPGEYTYGNANKAPKAASPKAFKVEKQAMVEGDGAKVEETPTKKENGKPWSAWDDKDPWA
ncbi:hypothetical protein PRZ48_008708 [Zasmidium cellare]|uniref:Uncharacterized protein n=1 Tax=Zasmidium cellare TaxID=395010 RepID=A0ABR0EGL8_ZASCE|nr:hypothetical protein PRZ48_008708 [Zasmidium cellare]